MNYDKDYVKDLYNACTQWFLANCKKQDIHHALEKLMSNINWDLVTPDDKEKFNVLVDQMCNCHQDKIEKEHILVTLLTDSRNYSGKIMDWNSEGSLEFSFMCNDSEKCPYALKNKDALMLEHARMLAVSIKLLFNIEDGKQELRERLNCRFELLNRTEDSTTSQESHMQ